MSRVVISPQDRYRAITSAGFTAKQELAIAYLCERAEPGNGYTRPVFEAQETIARILGRFSEKTKEKAYARDERAIVKSGVFLREKIPNGGTYPNGQWCPKGGRVLRFNPQWFAERGVRLSRDRRGSPKRLFEGSRPDRKNGFEGSKPQDLGGSSGSPIGSMKKENFPPGSEKGASRSAPFIGGERTPPQAQAPSRPSKEEIAARRADYLSDMPESSREELSRINEKLEEKRRTTTVTTDVGPIERTRAPMHMGKGIEG